MGREAGMGLKVRMGWVYEAGVGFPTCFSPGDHVSRFHFKGRPVELYSHPFFSDRGQVLHRLSFIHFFLRSEPRGPDALTGSSCEGNT